MKLIKKLTAAALTLLLVMAAAGCSSKDLTWAYEAEGERVPIGVYIVNEMNYFFQAEGDYQDSQEELGDYKQKDVLNHTIDGVGGEQWIINQTNDAMIRYFGARVKAQEIGYILPEDEYSAAIDSVASIWSGEMANYIMQFAMMYGGLTPDQYLLLLSQPTFEANGVALSSLENYFVNQTLQQNLFQELYGEGGEFAITDSEVKAKFEETYTKIGYMVMTKQTPTGAEEDPVQAAEDMDAANKELRALAESYVERLKAGEKIADIDFEYRQSVAAEGAEVNRRDDSLYETIAYMAEESTGDVLTDLIMSATGPAVDEDVYAVYIVVPGTLTDEDLETYRSSLMMSIGWEDYEARLLEWGNSISVTTNQDALNQYKPSKLKL